MVAWEISLMDGWLYLELVGEVFFPDGDVFFSRWLFFSNQKTVVPQNGWFISL